MIYREWKYEDILKISELEKECFQDAWTYKMFVEAFSSKLFYGVCAEENGEIAGYACETVLFENAEVDNVAVAENYRRRGMGKTLLKKLEKETDEGRSDLTSAAIKRQADLLMENGDKAGVAALYRKSMKDYARRAEVFEALMGQYYEYVSQDQDAVLQLAKEAESSYNRYIRTKSGDYFKVKKEAAIQRRIAGYYEKGGNGKKADSLRKDAEKREKNSKKGIREEN